MMDRMPGSYEEVNEHDPLHSNGGRTWNAHFLWQPRYSCFLTLAALSNVHWPLSCFQRCDHLLVFFLFLTCFLLSSCPRWSLYLSDLRLLCFYSGLRLFLNGFMLLTFVLFKRRFMSFDCGFLVTTVLPSYCSCYVYSHHFMLDIKIIGFFSPL